MASSSSSRKRQRRHASSSSGVNEIGETSGVGAGARASYRLSPVALYVGQVNDQTPDCVIQDLLLALGHGHVTFPQLSLNRSYYLSICNSHPGIEIHPDLAAQPDHGSGTNEHLLRIAQVINPNGWKGNWTWSRLQQALMHLKEATRWQFLRSTESAQAAGESSTSGGTGAAEAIQSLEDLFRSFGENRSVQPPTVYEYANSHQRIGFPCPLQPRSLPRWSLYRICVNAGIRTNPTMTENQMLRACELMMLEHHQLVQLLQTVATESIHPDIVSFLATLPRSVSYNTTRCTFSELQQAQTLLTDTNEVLSRTIPDTDAEAIVVAALTMHRDISCSRTPRLDLAHLRAGLLPKDPVLRRLVQTAPKHIDIRVTFNPQLPENLYHPMDLVNMSRAEGLPENEIIAEGAYFLLQQNALLETFTEWNTLTREGTPIELVSQRLLIHGDHLSEIQDKRFVVLYGQQSTMVAVHLDELTESFLQTHSFTNFFVPNHLPGQERSALQPFPMHAIRKLRAYARSIISAEHEMRERQRLDTERAARLLVRASARALEIDVENIQDNDDDTEIENTDNDDDGADDDDDDDETEDPTYGPAFRNEIQRLEQQWEREENDQGNDSGRTGQQIPVQEDDDSPLVQSAKKLLAAIAYVETSSMTQFASLEHFVREFGKSQREQCMELLTLLLRLSMTMRGWDGKSTSAYPVHSTPTLPQNLIDVNVTEAWTAFFGAVERFGNLGQRFLDLPLVRWRGEFIVSRLRAEGRTLRERLEIVRRNTTQESCIRLSSNWLCATVYRYMTAFQMVPPFSIELLRDIA